MNIEIEETVLQLKIRTKLQEINKIENVPFELTVSIGMSKSDNGKTLKELIDDADAKMYKEKMEKKQ